MMLEQFTASLSETKPPVDLHPILQGLWYDANNDWEKAHNIAQSREGEQRYDRLHAYLHRKEGDLFNAGYWYRRAKAPVFEGSLANEWKALVQQELGT